MPPLAAYTLPMRDLLADPTASLVVGLVTGVIFATAVSFIANELSARWSEARAERRAVRERTRAEREVRARETLEYVRPFTAYLFDRVTKRPEMAPTSFDFNRYPNRSIRIAGDREAVRRWMIATRRWIRREVDATRADEEMQELFDAADAVIDAVAVQLERILAGAPITELSRETMREIREEADRAVETMVHAAGVERVPEADHGRGPRLDA